MTIFLSLMQRHRGLLTLAVLASLLSAAAGIALLNEVNRLIAGSVVLSPARGGGFAVLLLLMFACGFGAQALLTALGHRVVYALRLQMVKRVLDTPLEQLEKLGSASLYATLSKDIEAIGMAFNRLPFLLYNGILMGGGLVYLAWLSWSLLLLAALVLALGVWLAYGWFARMQVLMAKVRNTEDKLYAAYETAIDGRLELALNARRKQVFFLRDMQPAAEQARAHEVHADRYWTLSLNWTMALILGLAGGLFAAGAALGLPASTVAAFVLVLVFLRMPLNDLIGSLPILMAGNVALAKIDSLALAAHHEGFDAPAPAAMLPGEEALRLEGLVFEYPHAADDYGFRLGPVDLSVRAGETLFIVGGNGSGKSTLAKLLTGLYQATSGRLILRGQDVTAERMDWYRSHFATVFSTFHLFQRLVGPAGDFDAPLAQAWLQRLRMERKVSIDSEGRLSTTQLSQGQRKRLALLVALVEERPLLLLDEWAADQDPAFREFFYVELLPELKAVGKTVIAISHDDRYFGVADRVIRCEGGRLLEHGKTVASLDLTTA